MESKFKWWDYEIKKNNYHYDIKSQNYKKKFNWNIKGQIMR